MNDYINTYGLLCFTANNVDYISNKGDTVKLPFDNEQVKTYVALGYLVAVDKKITSKT